MPAKKKDEATTAATAPQSAQAAPPGSEESPKRKGRPPGSKNKPGPKPGTVVKKKRKFSKILAVAQPLAFTKENLPKPEALPVSYVVDVLAYASSIGLSAPAAS